MELRFASMKDASAIVSLIHENSLYFPFYKEASFQDEVCAYIEANLALVAMENEQLLGVLCFHEGRAELDLLCVAETARRHGVARELLALLMKQFDTGVQLTIKVFDLREGQLAFLKAMKFQRKKAIQRFHHTGVCYTLRIA